MNTSRKQSIRRALLNWFAREKRDLPWRRTTDLYAILVSEIMLQQTQVDRVIPKYQAFLRRWPTVQHLARAKRASVIAQWSGLGYNRRAVHLHRAAQAIIADHDGIVPTDTETLEQLPGIGPYTARAVATFAQNKFQSFIDTNVRRVLGRVVFGIHFVQLSDDPQILQAAEDITPPRRAGNWHGALMDLGATICKPKPDCTVCPLQKQCKAYPTILTHPEQRAKKKTEAFRNSNRYWRGQIVALLRTHGRKTGLTLMSITKQLPRTLPRQRLASLLDALQKDGLVKRKSQRYTLA